MELSDEEVELYREASRLFIRHVSSTSDEVLGEDPARTIPWSSSSVDSGGKSTTVPESSRSSDVNILEGFVIL